MSKSTGSAGASVWTFALLAGASLLLSFAWVGPVSPSRQPAVVSGGDPRVSHG